MNKTIAKVGALIVTITVCLFAVCMLIPFDFGSYFVCLLLAIGYVLLASGFSFESDVGHRTAAIAFAIIYAVLIMPMTGIFTSMASGETSIGGVIALEFWCAYFIPVGILSTIHFSKNAS